MEKGEITIQGFVLGFAWVQDLSRVCHQIVALFIGFSRDLDPYALIDLTL
jgi:hypothetical protein